VKFISIFLDCECAFFSNSLQGLLPCRELQLENGLPLGISTDAEYLEAEFVTTGSVTFMSDGVVEARDSRGELLGFERMAALTSKTAAEIAEAAQRWGQEDDITVLTVRCFST